MRIRRISSPDFQVMPWKNGRGSTTQLAIHPEGAGLEDFTWRLSMARVADSGPFSPFPGCDRTLLLLSGGGLVLEREGHPDRRLEAPLVPVSFRGEEAIHGRLPGDPCRDFNVITRRSRCRHALDVVHGPGRTVDTAPTTLVLAVSGRVRLRTGDPEAWEPVDDGSLLWIEAPPPLVEIHPGPGATALVVRIFPSGG
jgi:hypothetical protein